MPGVATIEPVVQVDTREQALLRIEMFPTETVTLQCGDYGVRGFSDLTNPQFICERKSLDDLVQSLSWERARFMREIELLRRFRFAALLIEGDRAQVEAEQYHSRTKPQSILATLDAIAVRTGVHIFWCSDAEGASRQLESLVRQFARGIVKDYERLTKPNKEKES